MIDNKEYARQLRTNAAKDENGVIRCSPELWEEIARIIENSEKVMHGYWKDIYGNKYANHLYECSVCGEKPLYKFYTNELGQIKTRQALTPACPYCGAKMVGRNDE